MAYFITFKFNQSRNETISKLRYFLVTKTYVHILFSYLVFIFNVIIEFTYYF